MSDNLEQSGEMLSRDQLVHLFSRFSLSLTWFHNVTADGIFYELCVILWIFQYLPPLDNVIHKTVILKLQEKYPFLNQAIEQEKEKHIAIHESNITQYKKELTLLFADIYKCELDEMGYMQSLQVINENGLPYYPSNKDFILKEALDKPGGRIWGQYHVMKRFCNFQKWEALEDNKLELNFDNRNVQKTSTSSEMPQTNEYHESTL